MKLATLAFIAVFLTVAPLFAQDPVPCALPYPEVTDLSVLVNDDDIELTYTPVEGAIACRFKLQKLEPLGSPAEYAFDSLLVPGVFTIPGNRLEFETIYGVGVACGCSEDPLIFGEYSPPIFFFSGATGQLVPCENPYPQVTELNAGPSEAEDGITLTWKPIPQSKACRIEYRSDGGPLEGALINGIALEEFTLFQELLLPNTDYSWRVKCGCQWDPLVAGAWSQIGVFFTDSIGTSDGFVPKPRFTAMPVSPILGTQIEFTDRSSLDPTEWLWDFGDGTTSTEQNPVHVYSSAGQYTVSLTSTNAAGSETEIREAYINIFSPNCPESVADIEGNTYSVVQMGNTCWTRENLLATQFNNGDSIPNIEPVNVWNDTTAPAYCNYDNNIALGDTIGRLYNGYVILDDRNVCPAGWHVPMETEWLALEELVGMDADELNIDASSRGRNLNIGGQLKSTEFWSPVNVGGRDSYGFSATPAGYRFIIFLDFSGLQSLTRFNVVNDLAIGPELRYRDFSYLSRGISRGLALMSQGTPIRCVQD